MKWATGVFPCLPEWRGWSWISNKKQSFRASWTKSIKSIVSFTTVFYFMIILCGGWDSKEMSTTWKGMKIIGSLYVIINSWNALCTHGSVSLPAFVSLFLSLSISLSLYIYIYIYSILCFDINIIIRIFICKWNADLLYFLALHNDFSVETYVIR